MDHGPVHSSVFDPVRMLYPGFDSLGCVLAAWDHTDSLVLNKSGILFY